MSHVIKKLALNCTELHMDVDKGFIEQLDAQKFAQLLLWEVLSICEDELSFEAYIRIINRCEEKLGLEL